MGKRGPAKTPPALAVLRGETRPSRVNLDAPTPPPVKPHPPDYLDLDSDDDGISDTTEDTVDIDGDGVADTDVDGDGVPNRLDDDSDGDGLLDIDEGEVDNDGDGIGAWVDADEEPADTGDTGTLDTSGAYQGGGGCSCSVAGVNSAGVDPMSIIGLGLVVGGWLGGRRRRA